MKYDAIYAQLPKQMIPPWSRRNGKTGCRVQSSKTTDSFAQQRWTKGKSREGVQRGVTGTPDLQRPRSQQTSGNMLGTNINGAVQSAEKHWDYEDLTNMANPNPQMCWAQTSADLIQKQWAPSSSTCWWQCSILDEDLQIYLLYEDWRARTQRRSVRPYTQYWVN